MVRSAGREAPASFSRLPGTTVAAGGREKTMVKTIRIKRLTPVQVLMVSRFGGSRREELQPSALCLLP